MGVGEMAGLAGKCAGANKIAAPGATERRAGRLRAGRMIGVAIAIGAASMTFARMPLANAQVLAAGAQNYTVDAAASTSLTDYFKRNRLPLVGAQVGKDPAGDRRVVLYGYVATPQGQRDAEQKATAFLGAPAPQIVDRIVLQPEIANMPNGGASGPGGSGAATVGSAGDYAGAGAAGTGGVSFDQIIDAIGRYGVKSPPDDQNPAAGTIGSP
ncbi:MAG TPA: hypothetical protein VND20_09555 [Candidatus Binataceae bacterium]|nr:hypothetical protein [Candidatus Binataceae bacterium]